MSEPNPNKLEEQIAQLQSALAHHQHDYDRLNEVVIEQGKRLERLEQLLTRTDARLQELMDHLPADKLDPLDEKPPHY